MEICGLFWATLRGFWRFGLLREILLRQRRLMGVPLLPGFVGAPKVPQPADPEHLSRLYLNQSISQTPSSRNSHLWIKTPLWATAAEFHLQFLHLSSVASNLKRVENKEEERRQKAEDCGGSMLVARRQPEKPRFVHTRSIHLPQLLNMALPLIFNPASQL